MCIQSKTSLRVVHVIVACNSLPISEADDEYAQAHGYGKYANKILHRHVPCTCAAWQAVALL